MTENLRKKKKKHKKTQTRANNSQEELALTEKKPGADIHWGE